MDKLYGNMNDGAFGDHGPTDVRSPLTSTHGSGKSQCRLHISIIVNIYKDTEGLDYYLTVTGHQNVTRDRHLAIT